MNIDEEKQVELKRYDDRAKEQLLSSENEIFLGSNSITGYLRSPYLFYEQKIAEFIKPGFHVLELGAGSGLHTRALVETGALVTATDIAPNALKLIEQSMIKAGKNVDTQVADMEQLPFKDNLFDVVTCAGSLSYGEPVLVNAEIQRVLKPGGILICVDSLNHNPIYRFNRWIHHLRGDRSKSTLSRMPTLSRMESLGKGFSTVDMAYFGAFSFLMPIFASVLGQNATCKLSDKLDRILNIKGSAFKFVLVARGFNKVVVD